MNSTGHRPALAWDNPGTQNKKYNGKEFVEMHGLDEYDSMARWYYPAINRTTTIDPLAEMYYSISPYAWCGNNPINAIDPDGMMIDDYYSSTDGKYLGTDNSYTDNMRLIEDDTYNSIANSYCPESYGLDAATTPEDIKTSQLQENSKMIKIDNDKIQSDIQTARDNSLSTGLEHQVVLYLDRASAIISSVIGKTGTNSECTIAGFPAESQGLTFVDNNDSPRNKIIIGQAHGHPDSTTPNYITERTMSGKDKNTSNSWQIPIYGLDAMSSSGSRGSAANYHRVTPNGIIINNIGRTKGSGRGAFNIGLDALKIWGNSGAPVN